MSAPVALLLLVQVGAAPGTVVVAPPDGHASATDSAWIGEAVADTLPRDLALLGVPVVDRTDRLRAQEALEIPALTLTRATCIRIAEVVGASRLVIGAYQTQGSDVTLSLRLLDVERGTLSPPLRAVGPLETLADLIHALAWDIALSGPTRPTRMREVFLALRAGVPFEAFRSYAEGLAAADAASSVARFKQALGLMPTYDEARLALGRLHLEARDYAAAREALSKVGRASPLARAARFLEGVALLEMGRYQEAAVVYSGLASEDPTPAVLNNHAAALLRFGAASERASQVLRKAVEMAPGVVDFPFNLGWALLVEGEPEAAAFWLRGVAREDPRDTHARVVLAWALRKAGKVKEADEEWRGLTALASSFESLSAPDLTRRFERILPSERLLVLDQEGRSDAELAASHLVRAEKLLEGAETEGALRELNQAAYLDPYGARVHRLLARAHRAHGDSDKAVSELRMSLWCREDSGVRLELSALLKDLGRPTEARAEAEKVLRDDPRNEAARKAVEKP